MMSQLIRDVTGTTLRVIFNAHRLSYSRHSVTEQVTFKSNSRNVYQHGVFKSTAQSFVAG